MNDENKSIGLLGFDSEDPIGPGLRCALRSEAYVSGKNLRVVIPDDIAQDFQILSIIVGRINVMFGATGVPATLFSNAPCNGCGDERLRMLLPSVKAGCPVDIEVKNITAAGRRFRCAIELEDYNEWSRSQEAKSRQFWNRERLFAASPAEVARNLLGMTDKLEDALTLLENGQAWPDDAQKAARLLRLVLGKEIE